MQSEKQQNGEKNRREILPQRAPEGMMNGGKSETADLAVSIVGNGLVAGNEGGAQGQRMDLKHADVLVVDDDEDIVSGTRRELSRSGYSMVGATSYEEAERALQEYDFRMVITDMNLGTGEHWELDVMALGKFLQAAKEFGIKTGEDVVILVRGLLPCVPILVRTGVNYDDVFLRFLREYGKTGNLDFMRKSILQENLIRRVKDVIGEPSVRE